MKLKSIPLIFECYNFTLYLIKCTPPYFKETKSVKKKIPNLCLLSATV